ncbi:MAG: hypothetical protein AAGA48_04685 [Myxococcota bacterium]
MSKFVPWFLIGSIGCVVQEEPTETAAVTSPDPEVQCLEVMPESVDFGEWPLAVLEAEGPISDTIFLTNRCANETGVTQLALTSAVPGPFVVDADVSPENPLELAAGERIAVTVELRDPTYGVYTDVVNVQGAEGTSFEVTLEAQVVCEASTVDSDADGDGVPDACDLCLLGDDTVDSDADGVPDDCDACPNADDAIDIDADGIPDGCDVCSSGPNFLDSDQDSVPDACDVCPGADDRLDRDLDDIPDDCDVCPKLDNTVDLNMNGIADCFEL